MWAALAFDQSNVAGRRCAMRSVATWGRGSYAGLKVTPCSVCIFSTLGLRNGFGSPKILMQALINSNKLTKSLTLLLALYSTSLAGPKI